MKYMGICITRKKIRLNLRIRPQIRIVFRGTDPDPDLIFIRGFDPDPGKIMKSNY